MKFSDLDKDKWEELQPYLDTCVLPVTGLSGGEAPADMTAELERLRDVLDLIEQPFRGRIVTLPAFHYTGDDRAETAFAIGRVCRAAKRDGGFRFAVVVTANADVDAERCTDADLVLKLAKEDPAAPRSVSEAVQKLWQGAGA